MTLRVLLRVCGVSCFSVAASFAVAREQWNDSGQRPFLQVIVPVIRGHDRDLATIAMDGSGKPSERQSQNSGTAVRRRCE